MTIRHTSEEKSFCVIFWHRLKPQAITSLNQVTKHDLFNETSQYIVKHRVNFLTGLKFYALSLLRNSRWVKDLIIWQKLKKSKHVDFF
jgi:hypothetical protein